MAMTNDQFVECHGMLCPLCLAEHVERVGTANSTCVNERITHRCERCGGMWDEIHTIIGYETITEYTH